MASQEARSGGPSLERLPANPAPTFTTPSKQINDGDDLTFFLSSTAYGDLMTWLLQLNRSMFPLKTDSGKISESRLDSPPEYSKIIENLRSLLSDLEALIKDAPPDTGPRRFGNVAFRTWFKRAEEEVVNLLEKYLFALLQRWSGDDQQNVDNLRDELKVYLMGSFGSAQRLDYGTGHELSFLAFLACLWKLGAFEDGEEQSIVMGLVHPYLGLIRTLVLTYTLEPAGSHGVWGLDDHSFAPYIFGSAQLGPAVTPTSPTPVEGSLPEAPAPSAVTEKRLVADYKDSNMYFSAIQFIYDVKRGPFWEHSPVLYDISGIKDGWGKINKGMLKMYAAEVLGKFPVVQHFPFGSLFKWDTDPEARAQQSTVHAQNQPARSMDVPSGPTAGPGTRAPWAAGSAGVTLPQMQSATGMPSTRAPWANTGAGRSHAAHTGPNATINRAMPAQAGNMEGTAASWVSAQRSTAAQGTGVPSTVAPWARQSGSSR